jgi:flagellar hook-length control protein FliK
MIDIMPTPSVVAAAPKAAPPAADAMDPSRPGFAAMMTAAAPVMAGGRSPVRDADEPLAAEVVAREMPDAATDGAALPFLALSQLLASVMTSSGAAASGAGAAAASADPLASPMAAPSSPPSPSLASAMALPAATLATPGSGDGVEMPAPSAASLGTAMVERQLDLARDDRWVAGLARDIATASASPGQLSFRLDPAHLGRLDVTLRPHEAGLAIRLEAEGAEARQLIAAAQPGLVQELRQQGLRVADAALGWQTGQQPNQGQNQGQNQGSGLSQSGPDSGAQPHQHGTRRQEPSPDWPPDDRAGIVRINSDEPATAADPAWRVA